MKLKELYKWMDMYLSDQLKDDQRKAMDDWLEEQCVPVKLPDMAVDQKQVMKDRIWRKTGLAVEKKPLMGRWSRMAAVIVIIGGAFLTWYFTSGPSAANQHKLILPDGSLVWLRGESELDHGRFTLESRQVFLTGEALFEVEKDSLHPFIIHCGGYTASVMGTSFNIRSEGERLELYVLTGKVRLSSVALDTNVVVSSNERLVLNPPEGVVQKLMPAVAERQRVIASTQYDMHFEDSRVADIVTRIEQKFNITIVLQHPAISNCRISADFTDQSLEVTLSMMTEALGLDYIQTGSKILIRGEGCR